MQLQSTFALLDVRHGRVGLLKAVGFSNENKKLVPVVIHGFIDSAWGHDDGDSREFEVHVTKVEAGEPQ